MNQKEFIKKRLSTYSGIKTYSEFIGWAFNALCNKLKSEGFFIDVNSDYEDLYARLPGSKAIVKFTFDPSMCKWTYIYMGGADEGDRLKKAVESIDLTTPEMKGDVPTELRAYSADLDEARSELISMVDEVDYDEEFADKIKDKIKSSDRDALISMLDEEIKAGEGSKDWKKSIDRFKSIRAKLSTNSLDHTPIDLKEVDNFMVTKFPQYQCTSNNYDDSRKYEDGKRVIGISLDRKRKDKFTVTSWYGDDLKGIVEIEGKGINDLKTTLTTQAEKLKTYSAWPFILKALGGAVIGQLVAKAFNRAKFKQPSNKELFDATLKKFKDAKTPEDAEKYYKMLISQLNDSENKEEVKQYISEVKEESESKM